MFNMRFTQMYIRIAGKNPLYIPLDFNRLETVLPMTVG
jgi:hypothetical protein